LQNNRTIGILTLQNSNNYGAMYQTYALSRYLENRGHKVFIIDYEMTRDTSGLFDYLKHPVSFIQKLFYRKEQILNSLFNKKSTPTIDRKQAFIEIFDQFRKSYLNITKEEYNYQKLLDACPEADVYICGSDQIWAADFLFTSPAFLLGFVPKGTKRVSYAASFGKNRLETYLDKPFRKYINQFDAVSVREKSGVDIVNSFSDMDAKHVLDPTLLLDKDDYLDIIDYSLVPDEPYIFVYKLNQTKELSDWMDSCINEISKKEHLSVLAVSTNLVYPFDENWKELHPTPGQLLGLIEKSTVTTTNSFHGTVFSIILQTKFLSFARDSYKDKQNVRMEELLSNLDLESFYCEPFLDVINVSGKLGKKYDYDNTFTKLSAMRRDSEVFLESTLK
jgi:hypothetical protein